MRRPRLLVLYACTMLLMICLGIGYIVSMEHDLPEIVLLPLPAVLTPDSEISVLLYDKSSGVRSVEVTAVINGWSLPVLSQEFPPGELHREISFTLPEIPATEGFRDETGNVRGELRIVVSDHSTIHWDEGNKSSLSSRFVFDDTPPRAEITAISEKIVRGGSAAVSFRVSEPLTSAELVFGERSFKAYPQSDLDYTCIFALPCAYTVEEFRPELRIRDTAGHEASIPLEMDVLPYDQQIDQITVSTAFMRSKSLEFARSVPDEQDPLKLFLTMNGEIRQQNYARECLLIDI